MSIPKLVQPVVLSTIIIIAAGCSNQKNAELSEIYAPGNTLDYIGTPKTPQDRTSLVFSDQGAWFGYGLPDESEHNGGFSGPFLMIQENGVWSSPILSQLQFRDVESNELVDWEDFEASRTSYISHLEQTFKNKKLKVSQILFFISGHSAVITTQIKNLSSQIIQLNPIWVGTSFLPGLQIEKETNGISLTSSGSLATGSIQSYDQIQTIKSTDSSYVISLESLELQPGESNELVLSHTFIFPEYDSDKEQILLKEAVRNPKSFLKGRKDEKQKQLNTLFANLDTTWTDSVYKDLVAKSVLTLQNNWRIPAGELKHSGLFPSYHYIWFHGFWAWDSWKHAVALSQYDIELAKEQIRAMFDFQNSNGFIADCVYRDTTIENHNYRNTKPPLLGWAVWEIYKKSNDLSFLDEVYPKVLNQHNWWYNERDHDKDGLCEYGSTDGTLIAAKWESGMDNAVRFDSSRILKNSDRAYSLDQESVDLNAYLYAEKNYLIKIASQLDKNDEAEDLAVQAHKLKFKILNQFFDEETGWFYDTSIDGIKKIEAMGCEGWIPLWAEVATQEQAEAVRTNMINPEYFNTKVPFQTLSANHPKFKPDNGYWRGPNWLDQAYFGIKGLRNYGYHQDAYEATSKLIHNAEGVLVKGSAIRENYQPITGKGLESKNFSWSAAHYLLLLLGE